MSLCSYIGRRWVDVVVLAAGGWVGAVVRLCWQEVVGWLGAFLLAVLLGCLGLRCGRMRQSDSAVVWHPCDIHHHLMVGIVDR